MLAQQPVEQHTCDLAGDDVVGDGDTELLGRGMARQQPQARAVHSPQVAAVLPRVVEPGARDLRVGAAAAKAGHGEGVLRAGADVPVGLGGTVAVGAGRGAAVVEESCVGAVPAVGLDGEGVGGVRRALVVAVDGLGVDELVVAVLLGQCWAVGGRPGGVWLELKMKPYVPVPPMAESRELMLVLLGACQERSTDTAGVVAAAAWCSAADPEVVNANGSSTGNVFHSMMGVTRAAATASATLSRACLSRDMQFLSMPLLNHLSCQSRQAARCNNGRLE
ncbi:hypothetical protein FH972_025566 [Carpinus fangiana]|uniref:Uncharacterized protein n=1 Tax=Carpinus fangiana TaxID=176857 RepID=A0A5N6L3Z3_9ROSI|nr:hypothetical protein FH972_025566 [Carpinus fangiana]